MQTFLEINILLNIRHETYLSYNKKHKDVYYETSNRNYCLRSDG